MRFLATFATIALLFSPFALGQQASSELLAPGTTLPIRFVHSIDTAHAHPGGQVLAKTIQQVHLANGQVLPAGSNVLGHVLSEKAFIFNKTHYAKQTPSALSISFDSIQSNGTTFPLHVVVRAMADPLTVWAAQAPKATDLDSLSTTTQIGGDLVTPSQDEIINQDGDIVGYNHRSGVVAHLISASGNSDFRCDSSDTEQAMGHFSASACGLYGYTDTSLSASSTSTITLVSRRRSAKIWAKSEVLLEVIGQGSNTIPR